MDAHPRRRADWVLAVVVGGVGAASFALQRDDLVGAGSVPADLVVRAVLVVAAVVTLSRRRRPGRVVVPLTAVIAVSLLLDASVFAMLLLVELLFACTRYGTRRTRLSAWLLGALVTVALLVAALAQPAAGTAAAALVVQDLLLCLLAVWWARDLRLLAERRAREVARQERVAAHERSLVVADHSLQVAQERAQLARDVHDVVAGRLAAISLQSSMARAHVDDASRAGTLVGDIHHCSGATLEDVREMIDRLGRSDDRRGPAARGAVRSLRDLVVSARLVGVDMDLRDELGDRDDLPCRALHLAAQEAVVNMIRHAAPCSGEVSLVAVGHDLRLSAWNTVDAGSRPGPAAGEGEHRPGVGMSGMRERLLVHGGHVSGRLSADGRRWLLDASVPVPPAPRPPVSSSAVPSGADASRSTGYRRP